jgi:hypothetical protein
MSSYRIFIDESGTAKPETYKVSPYFSLCGVLIGGENGHKLTLKLNFLKEKYFANKNFVIHAADLRWNLKVRKKTLSAFAIDLGIILNECRFYLLYSLVYKEKSLKANWVSKTVYEYSYKSLLESMLKFLVTKKMRGEIVAEISSFNQDQHLYKVFVKLIQLGIKKFRINHSQAKTTLSSLSFVTKLNNDAESQLADLFGIFGRLQEEINSRIREKTSLDELEEVVYRVGKQRIYSFRKMP